MKTTHIFKRSIMASLVGIACMATGAGAQTASSNQLVLESMTIDKKADPCTDFFQYSNGEWLKANPIPADRARYSAYDEVTERNLAALKQIAEAAAKGEGKSKAAQLVGAFYASGMNEEQIEKEGVKPLESQFAKINAIKDGQQLLTVIAGLHKQGVMPLFGFSVDQDAKNTTRYIPQITQGGLGLPDRDYYLKTDAKTKDIREKYLAHVTQIFTLLGDAPDLAKKNAAIVMSMETRLAKASLTKVELRDPQASYHLSDLDALQKGDKKTAW